MATRVLPSNASDTAVVKLADQRDPEANNASGARAGAWAQRIDLSTSSPVDASPLNARSPVDIASASVCLRWQQHDSVEDGHDEDPVCTR